MPARIQDEFASMRISRQRKYQLRREKEGRCRLCGEKAEPDQHYCETHLKRQREHVRRVVSAADLI